MDLAYLAVAVTTVALNAGAAIADFARADFVLKNAAAVRIPEHRIPALGTLKAAGAIGVLLGLLGVAWVGVAAAAGLVLFFIGAIVVHIRCRVFGNIAAPATYLALAVATLALGAVRAI